jgi:RHS repeat-associated protein
MPEPITSTSSDANNRQLTFGDKTLAYDDNGNLQSITDSSGTTLYNWNARNQLVSISGPSVNASFVYDGTGRREKKTINGSLTEFLYDSVNPVQETSGATILANILPGLGIDEFLTRTDVVAGITSHFLTDTLGSPVAVTDNTGAVQTEFTYESFGKTTITGASNTSPFQYTGRENDGTGLYYYRARFYHPVLQRFVSEDPSNFSGGDFNVYAYVKNNPTTFSDPLGLQPVPLNPGALGEALKLIADLLDAKKDQLGGLKELNESFELIREIEEKVKAKGQDACDSWVRICILMPTPTRQAVGSVRVYGLFKMNIKLDHLLRKWVILTRF